MIRLYKNNAFKWNENNNVYTIGYAFYKDKLYRDEELTKLIIELRDSIFNEINEFTGYFAIVIQEGKKIILISDIIRSFPLFYNSNGDVTDDIELLKNDINELSLKELLHARWVSVDETIYKDVYQIENAQIVVLQDNKITKNRYYTYSYIKNTIYSFEELDNVFKNITNRMVKYLDGRTALIPLSGGQDSRLLLYYLKESGYDKIITYTYGNKNGEEVEVSKKVAEFLNVPWYFIEYTKRNCRKKYNNKKLFKEISEYFGRGYAVPHLQEWEAIDELFSKNIINKDYVVLPGFTLDFITGSHLLFDEFLEESKLHKKVIREKIYANNYTLTKYDNNIFNEKLEKKFGINFDEGDIEAEKAAELYERFDFEERQAKFINNAVRVYDYYGLKWYLPFWDKELINFWNKVSIKDRFQRKYFLDFVNKKYGDLMKYAPVVKKDNTKKKLNIIQKIYYVFYKYNNHSLNFFYYFKFSTYLKYIIFERNASYNYYIAKDYVKNIRN